MSTHSPETDHPAHRVMTRTAMGTEVAQPLPGSGWAALQRRRACRRDGGHTVNIDWECARVDGTVKRLRVWAEGYHFHRGRAILPICGHGATVEDALHRAQAVAAASDVQLGQHCSSSCPRWVAK